MLEKERTFAMKCDRSVNTMMHLEYMNLINDSSETSVVYYMA